MSSLIIILIVIVAAFLILRTTIRVVPQQRAWVVERLGKYHAVLEPGLNFIIPFHRWLLPVVLKS